VKWLQKQEKNSHVAFRAANYTDVRWWFHTIPGKKGAPMLPRNTEDSSEEDQRDGEWETFKRRFYRKTAIYFCSIIGGGSVDCGVKLMARLLDLVSLGL